ncbi:hypothetical protein N9V83_03295 [Flavobacteriales bacterium]|nr:hypothetical protein [Flavobacteriales bacterium]
MRKIVCLLGILLLSLTIPVVAQDNVRLVYGSTTASAIDELNKLVPNYEERKQIILQMKKMEKEGMVFLSSEEILPIQNKINSATNNPQNEFEKEEKVYATNAQRRYKCITELVK